MGLIFFEGQNKNWGGYENFGNKYLFIQELHQFFKTCIRTRKDDLIKKWEPTNVVPYHIEIA